MLYSCDTSWTQGQEKKQVGRPRYGVNMTSHMFILLHGAAESWKSELECTFADGYEDDGQGRRMNLLLSVLSTAQDSRIHISTVLLTWTFCVKWGL